MGLMLSRKIRTWNLFLDLRKRSIRVLRQMRTKSSKNSILSTILTLL